MAASTPEARSTTHGGGWRVAWLFVLPALLVFALFYLWPAINTIVSSLFTWSILRPWQAHDPATWRYAGLDNYVAVLTEARFWNAALNTLIWLVVFPLLATFLSLLIALLIWEIGRGARLFRTIFVLPMTVSLTAAGVLWALVFNPQFGVLSAALGAVGLSGAEVDVGPLHVRLGDWLSNPGSLALGPVTINLVNLTAILPAVWALTGFGVISLTAGLTAISPELIEAATVEGAGRYRIARDVVIPQLRGALIIVGVVFVIYALRTFDVVWVTTQGGPGTDSEVIAVLLWRKALAFFDTPAAGEATAIAVLLSAVMVIGAYPYLRSLLREAPG
ncbi:MAG TPA: sugar ABC transporter permease [candidate division Zixibacteria bacterium]|nr:sugar ABC transporter permease [candidate division Zixibacteria bacterium]